MTNLRIMPLQRSNSYKTQRKLEPIYTWITSIHLHAHHWVNVWLKKRRIARNSRMLESLPSHILKDIGWPNVDEDLYGPQ